MMVKLKNWGCDLDFMWGEVVKKAINTKAKTSLQPSSRTRKIDFKCPKGYKLSAKKNKDKTNQEYWD